MNPEALKKSNHCVLKMISCHEVLQEFSNDLCHDTEFCCCSQVCKAEKKYVCSSKDEHIRALLIKVIYKIVPESQLAYMLVDSGFTYYFFFVVFFFF